MSRRTRQTGFSLVELLAAVAVLGVLMAAMSSAMVIAARTLPNDSRPVTRVLRGGAVAQQIVDELAEATAFTERGASAVTFLVADRDGDGAPEHIRYAWTGTSGDPLTRSYNGASPNTVAAQVHDFSLGYTLRSQTETYPGAVIASAETDLCSWTTAVNEQTLAVKEKNWAAQRLAPLLPADAISWCITRVKVRARSKGANLGVAAIQIRVADASTGLPTTTVLAEQLMPESGLSEAYAWRDFAFAEVKEIAPSERPYLAIVNSVKDSDICEIAYDDKNASGMAETSSAESGWKAKTPGELLHVVMGKYTRPGPDQTAVRRYVTAVDLRLQIGGDSTAAVRTSVRTVNEPELLRAFWELAAGQDPSVDRNGDSAVDFSTETLIESEPLPQLEGTEMQVGGELIVPVDRTPLSTNPAHNLDDLLTIAFKFGDRVANDGDVATATILADCVGAQCASVTAQATLAANGTQSIAVTTLTATGQNRTLASVSGLSAEPVSMRMLVDPALNTINVRIAGQDYGTFLYELPTILGGGGSVQFAPWGSLTADFSDISVRVGDRS